MKNINEKLTESEIAKAKKFKVSKETCTKFNITNDNYGFTWPILIDSLAWQYRSWLCTKATTRAAETARWTFKTYSQCLIFLFKLCNFTDWNGIILRKDKSTHLSTTIVTMKKVTNMLLKNYDIDLTQTSIHAFKWIYGENKIENKIVHPNKRVILFDSIGKYSDSQLGKEFEVGGIGDIWADEMSSPAKDIIEESDEEIYSNIQMLLGSAIRGEYTINDEPILEFCTYIPKADEGGNYILENDSSSSYASISIFSDGKENQISIQVEKSYFYKNGVNLTFTLNPWEENNFFHERYFEDIWPTSYVLEQNLLNQNILTYTANLDEESIFLVRASAWLAKDNAFMNPATERYLRKLKSTDYTYYRTIALGQILESSDLSKFTYRTDLKSVILRQTEPNEISILTIGIDWGFSKIKSKKSAITVSGVSNWNGLKWEKIYFLADWWAISKSNYVDSEDKKIESAAKFISNIYDEYKNYINKKPFVWYDLQDKVTARQIQKLLSDKYGLNLVFFPGAKHKSVLNKWDITARQAYFKGLLSSGRCTMNIRKCLLLYKELNNCINSKGSLIRDKRCANDATTALEYSWTNLHKIVNTTKLEK
ncbi:phage terminase large subunit [Spiroplasma endosymbiont of Aspidapion aeneum]|uniref:phage terminase large subunit n=1 Tax=Spiroplasma endosymbiont of Aspidapion aeneum TaxID=3066276 RepID=UPI00313D5129